MATLTSEESKALRDELRQLRQVNQQILNHMKLQSKSTYTAREVLEYLGLPSGGQRVRKVHDWYNRGLLNTLRGQHPRLYDGEEVRALKRAWLEGEIKLV